MKSKLIGITGGIGAGKSTVSKICKHLGFKVYNSDDRAKEIVSEDSNICLLYTSPSPRDS